MPLFPLLLLINVLDAVVRFSRQCMQYYGCTVLSFDAVAAIVAVTMKHSTLFVSESLAQPTRPQYVNKKNCFLNKSERG